MCLLTMLEDNFRILGSEKSDHLGHNSLIRYEGLIHLNLCHQTEAIQSDRMRCGLNESEN